ncbi:hypothetical protein GCM10011581_24630 [Saccharopolyspora subtropica]|uniref:Uncharacterized protein n=1 Tax=Saccharopolyspora thermophila TaxID=89367 RepID=A0A917NBV1_9PSEU|nr:hypothetical protein [Saccharopolyspora subtropica]GGI86600.1 hypothetical protein GCM10011581_24630 [Saccharopolyspora subtropica]
MKLGRMAAAAALLGATALPLTAPLGWADAEQAPQPVTTEPGQSTPTEPPQAQTPPVPQVPPGGKPTEVPPRAEDPQVPPGGKPTEVPPRAEDPQVPPGGKPTQVPPRAERQQPPSDVTEASPAPQVRQRPEGAPQTGGRPDNGVDPALLGGAAAVAGLAGAGAVWLRRRANTRHVG